MQEINKKYSKIKLIFSLSWLPIGAIFSFLFIISPIVKILCEIMGIASSCVLVLNHGAALQFFVMSGRINPVSGICVLLISIIYTIALYVILMEIIENKRIKEIKQWEQDEFFRNLV